MTNILSKIADNRGKIIVALGALTTGAVLLRSTKKNKSSQFSLVNRRTESQVSLSALEKVAKAAIDDKKENSTTKRAALNKQFLRDLKRLVLIAIPGIWSKEFFILSLHTLFLVSRTYLSIKVAQLDGAIVKTIVDRDVKGFLRFLFIWIALAVPATYINSMIRFLESKLAIAFRTRLVDHFYGLYMTNDTYYRVENLDSRLMNADQCLTEDVSKFCSALAHLHGQISKPLLDVILMTGQLLSLSKSKTGSSTRTAAPLGLAIFTIWLTVKALKSVSPPFGKLVAEQARLEGELRFGHSRLITNSEEISFYGGHLIENSVLRNSYLRLAKHMNNIYKLRIFYNMAEGFFMKYLWSAVGMLMVAIPAFYVEHRKKIDPTFAANVDDSVGQRTQDFITARGLLVSGADAIERIMSSYKELTELGGYTARVAEMLDVFQDVSKGIYKKQWGAETSQVLMLKRGELKTDSYIEFCNVPIVSPNGDILIKSLSFSVKKGMHLLITGPNGCGKSSLFRILGGLWPVYGGHVVKPPKEKIFYIPQRPYLCLGSLLHQIIYPNTEKEFLASGKTIVDIEEIMEWVNLLPIVTREGGWHAVNDWQDVLSGGEKQRVGFARLLYHKPDFAILDECTSAVSMDVEGQIYQKAIDLGITLITVTHRHSLWKYHNHLLQFDGEGHWEFQELNSAARTSFKEEKVNLESQLQGLPSMYKRLSELCKLLGEQSVLLNKYNENHPENNNDFNSLTDK